MFTIQAISHFSLIQINEQAKNNIDNHVNMAFRALLEQMDMLLGSAELSVKSKRIFTEEAENLFMKHGILCESYNENSQ